jgi:TonB family protein
VTRVEIVVARDGHIKRMGVIRSSGVVEFDVAVLDAIDRAQPFAAAPSEILSTDGNVYAHWELHRDEAFACSTINASPFLLVLPGSP